MEGRLGYPGIVELADLWIGRLRNPGTAELADFWMGRLSLRGTVELADFWIDRRRHYCTAEPAYLLKGLYRCSGSAELVFF